MKGLESTSYVWFAGVFWHHFNNDYCFGRCYLRHEGFKKEYSCYSYWRRIILEKDISSVFLQVKFWICERELSVQTVYSCCKIGCFG